MNREEFTVDLSDEEEIRADSFVASLGMFTRSQMAKRTVRVFSPGGKELKTSKRLRDGEKIIVEWDDPAASEINPEHLDMDILYEDEDCLVINKHQGVVVHPAHGNMHGTLVQGLLYRYDGLESLFGGDRVRPGIVHRLDKDTSGLIVAAKNPKAHEVLSRQFRDRTVKKTYLAITKGGPRDENGELNAPIGRDRRERKKFAAGAPNGKEAFTRYHVFSRSGNYSLVRVRIYTGRTHQIRVHMKSIGAPILGDSLYGRRDSLFPDAALMLHSWKLTIELPSGERRNFKAPIPDRFVDVMNRLELSIPDD